MCVRAIEPLTIADLDKKVFIRGEEHTVVQAINRQMTHYAYHIGQIVFLAKHFRSTDWKSLSVPRNKSAEFNAFLSTKEPRREAVRCGRGFPERQKGKNDVVGFANSSLLRREC